MAIVRVKTSIWFAFVWIFLYNLVGVSSALAAPAFSVPQELTQPSGEKFQATLQGDEWFNFTTAETGEIIVDNPNGYWDYGQLTAEGVVTTGAKYKISPKPQQTVKKDELLNWKKEKNKKDKMNGLPTNPYPILPAPIQTTQRLDASMQSSSVQSSPVQNTAQKSFRLLSQGGPLSSGPLNSMPMNQKLLVVLVQFTGTSIQDTEANWSSKIFGTNVGSVNDYYQEVSGGLFTFSPATESYGTANNGVIKVTLNYAHPNTGSSTGAANQLIVKNALTAADAYINFANFDTDGNGYISNEELHIVTIIAGYERSYSTDSPSVWGHRWSVGGTSATTLDGKGLCNGSYNGGYTQQGENHGTHRATIGILAHELGHDLGLPDLYDYDDSSAGVGAHSIMASGSWGSTTGQPGSSPTHFDAWSKMYLGFATPVVPSLAGGYTLKGSGTSQYNMIKIPTSDANQYFLLENRQFTGFDAALDNYTVSGGVAVWHIDESVLAATNWYGVNDNENHKAVDLEESNQGTLGYSQLDTKANAMYNHYYYSGGTTIISNSSTPNSKLFDSTPTNITVTATSTSSSSMTVNITSPDLITDNANLSALVLSNGVLNPVFAAGTTAYTASVASSVTSITVKPTVEDSQATIKVNGSSVTNQQYSQAINLNQGDNVISIVVTAQNGTTTKAYSLTVNRLASGLAPLTVTSVSPGEGAVQVSGLVYQKVTVTFDRDIFPGMDIAKVILKKSGKITACNREFSGKELTLNTLANLSSNETYQITIPAYGVKDANGMGMATPYSLSFKTTDTVAPVVKTANPVNNGIGFPTNKAILLTLSENIQEGTGFDNITLTTGGAPKTFSAAISGKILNITPTVALDYSTLYVVTIPGTAITDEGGNPLSTYTLSFTTWADKVKPTVVTTIPANKATTFPVTSDITITYNQDIVEGSTFSSIALKLGTTAVAVTPSVSGKTLTLSPGSDLQSYSLYTVSIPAGAVKDSSGNPAGALTLNFATDSKPSVISSLPLAKAVNVPLNQVITVNFSQNIAQGYAFGNITLKQATTLVPYNGSISGNTLTITPQANLATDKIYTLSIPIGGVKDTNSVASGVYTLSFTTIETVAPTAASTVPANNAINVLVKSSIKVTFNENIQAGANYSTIILQKGSTAVGSSKSINGKILTITPDENLDYATVYNLTIPSGAVLDLSGNGLAGAKNLSFTTAADKIKPVKVSVDPENKSINVPVDQSFTIMFDENIKQGLNYAKIALKAGKTIVPSTVSISGNALTINPNADLPYGTTCTLSVPGGAVTDLASNAAASITLTYLTIQDITVPIVSSSTPADDGSATATQNIVITISKTVVAGGNYAAITLKESGGTLKLGIAKTLSTNTLTINPSLNLKVGKTYQLYLPTGALKDSVGNTSAEYSCEFTVT